MRLAIVLIAVVLAGCNAGKGVPPRNPDYAFSTVSPLPIVFTTPLPKPTPFRIYPPHDEDSLIVFQYCGNPNEACEAFTVGDLRFLHALEKRWKP